MKRFWLFISGIFMLGGLIIAGLAFLIVLNQNPIPAKRLTTNMEHMNTVIDKQLSGIKPEVIKGKEHLIKEKSIQELQENIAAGTITYEDITAYYLYQIKETDQIKSGTNAISEINPNAIHEARKCDESKDNNQQMFGMPILIKENVNTNNMPTSAGTVALKNFIPKDNAPFVNQLKENGAIILGKTNLSELSYWLDKDAPSGFSAKNGQTLNPFKPGELSPSGSSSGSAVAMATDLAATSIGTETVGSIVSPASANSVVGFKPSRQRISNEGVVPISSRLDTVGPITRTVEDALITYNAATENQIKISLDKNYLKDKKIGIGIESGSENDVFVDNLTQSLQAMGVKVIQVEVDSSQIDADFIMKNDFEASFTEYLTEYDTPIKTLNELIAFNKRDTHSRIPYGQDLLQKSLNFKHRDNKKAEKIVKQAEDELNKLLDEYQLNALVSMNEKNVLLSAVAGAPELSVPFGLIDEIPVGATFYCAPDMDEELIKIGYSFEQHTELREIPSLKKD
ncbi:amidase family protein [Vagococcus silagei]|uniref:Amidase domain-containing protein n=1 Tax=Vagococcus silagei TaxID=2508885 RepID=A0A4S3B1S7_9ENTE|nr:amidase family protein [Vagococcus silagei]THB60197.1 hypothetical protein ESZ54_11640 [Vagococcus silagei]